MDPERKDPSKDGEGRPEGAQPTADTATSAPQTPDPKYKGLQQALEAEKAARKAAEAQAAALRGDPTAEEQLAELREEAERLRMEIALRDLKAQNPELTDVIDVAVAEGTKLTPGVLAAMKAKVAAPAQSAPARPETSGIRNSQPNASQTTPDEDKFMELLKSAKLF